MRIVLDGLLWRCRVRRNVAVLTGELFGPAPPGGGRAKSLGKCAFSGKWPVSDVDQLGVKTVVRARSLDRRAERSHLGDLPLYAIDEQRGVRRPTHRIGRRRRRARAGWQVG